MKHKSWLLVGSATVLAVGFAFYDFQSEKKNEELKSEKAKLVVFPVDQINQVEILSSDVVTSQKGKDPLLFNKIRLKRSADGWRLEEPIQELADQNQVQDFVEGVATEQASDVLMENEEIDWKVFGLDEPKGQVTVQNNLGEKITLFVSSKKNFQGEAFIRRDQGQKVFLASSNWFSRLEKQYFDFRDKKLLRKSMSGIESLTYTKGGEKLTLNYADTKWTSAEHPDWKLDQNKVRDVLGLFNSNLVTEFVKEAAPTTEELKKWGLQKPLASALMQFKDGTSFTADLGVDTDKYYYVLTSEPVQVVKIAAVDSSKFLGVRLDILRDRKQPFDFVKADILKIEVHGPEGLTVMDFDGKTWKAMAKADPALNLSAELASTLIDRLQALQVAEFMDRKGDVEPEPKTRSVRLFKAKDELVFELKLGEPQKKKVEGRDRSLVMARSHLYPDSFTLDAVSVRGLNLESFLKPSAPSATSSAPPTPPPTQKENR
ncbi:MAG: DUF4340 domain-containing protein [Bdellovibrio sp.]|jgi:hypothetical protein